MTSIQFNNATISYRGADILKDFSIFIEDEHCCIEGTIGSGKTTLLRAISGLAQVKKGQLSINKNEVEFSTLDFHNRVKLVDFTKPNKYFNPKNHFYQQRYHHQMEDDESSKSMTIEALLNLNGFSMVIIEGNLLSSS